MRYSVTPSGLGPSARSLPGPFDLDFTHVLFPQFVLVLNEMVLVLVLEMSRMIENDHH